MSNGKKLCSPYDERMSINYIPQTSPKFNGIGRTSPRVLKEKENIDFLNSKSKEGRSKHCFSKKTFDLRAQNDIEVNIQNGEIRQSYANINDYSFGSPNDDDNKADFTQSIKAELEIEPIFKRKAKLYNETLGTKYFKRSKNYTKEIPVKEKPCITSRITDKQIKLRSSCMNSTNKYDRQCAQQNFDKPNNLDTSNDYLARNGQSSVSAYRMFKDANVDQSISQTNNLRSLSSVDLKNRNHNPLMSKSSPKSIIELLSGDSSDVFQSQLIMRQNSVKIQKSSAVK